MQASLSCVNLPVSRQQRRDEGRRRMALPGSIHRGSELDIC
jgi:hypothetical protein